MKEQLGQVRRNLQARAGQQRRLSVIGDGYNLNIQIAHIKSFIQISNPGDTTFDLTGFLSTFLSREFDRLATRSISILSGCPRLCRVLARPRCRFWFGDSSSRCGGGAAELCTSMCRAYCTFLRLQKRVSLQMSAKIMSSSSAITA